MNDQLSIQNIEATAAENKIVILVTVMNRSNKDYFIWKGLRKVSYSIETHTLYIDLADKESPPPPPDIHVISKHPKRIPPQVRAPAGRTVIIAIPVARRIRKTSVVGNKIIVEDLPIGPVEHIVCDLGYNEAPLLASVSASPEEMHGLLHEGTRIIRGETDVSSAQLKLET